MIIGIFHGAQIKCLLSTKLSTSFQEFLKLTFSASEIFCCRFKDRPNCSHLIADSLDPSGGLLPAQVSNKIKQLGLKVAPKKRIRNYGRNFASSFDQQGGGSTLNDSNNLEESSQRQPL